LSYKKLGLQGRQRRHVGNLALHQTHSVNYTSSVKRAEVVLPDPIYQQVEGLAAQFHLTVPEFLCQAAAQIALRQAKPRPNGEWRFPEGRHLGAFRAPVGDWRLLANEAAD